MIYKILDKIKHQNIGGKKFIVDEKITETLSPKKVLNEALYGNFACLNFVNRREDFKSKLYYGKVDGLGYIVAEDEFETDENGKIIEYEEE